ncbi:hypothetical protein WJX77_006265 [Trebouxia sp. C0004]
MQRSHRRTWVVAGTASVAGAVLLYKLYHSERIARAWRQYQTLVLAFSSYNQTFLAGAEISAAISNDLKSFLQSDSQELPQSLRQLAQLFQAEETQAATSSIAAATIRGIMSATQRTGASASGGLDSVLGALTSETGHSLVSLAVSVAARTSTRTYCECIERSAAAAKASEQATGVLADTIVQQVLRFACTPEGERLCMMGVTNFVTNATSVYCQNLEGTNFWSDLFAAMVKPEHKQVAGHMTRCFVNELANTVRRPAPPNSDERAQSPGDGKGAELARQQQVPEAKQTATQSRHAATKVPSQSMARADAKQKPSLSLQARTGVLPFTGSCSQADMPPGQCLSGPQSWYSTTGTAVVREAIKVLRIPEGRMMLLSLSAIAIAEGIQTGYHGVKEACSDNIDALQQVSLSEGGKIMGMSMRQLYAALSIVIMLMLYINGQRASLHHA